MIVRFAIKAWMKRFLLTILLVTASAQAAATDYSDIWFNPAEAGWGMNLVQSDNFMFLTFFIYGSDSKPTWFTGQVTLDANSNNFNGTLYATTGTYYILPWSGFAGGVFVRLMFGSLEIVVALAAPANSARGGKG